MEQHITKYDSIRSAHSLARVVSQVIADGDEMFVGNRDHYFSVGREALGFVRQACALAGLDDVESILDLPCGHGRVMRWLRVAFPQAQLTGSDLNTAAVSFCATNFGAIGIPAGADDAHWGVLRGPFDVIWCGSLLTHLEPPGWVEHLRRFGDRLSARGVLIFTTHGMVPFEWMRKGERDYGLPPASVKEVINAVDKTGFGYAPYPASDRYGMAVAQPRWVRMLIARETTLRVVHHGEAAWDHHQDVVMCRPQPGLR